MAVLTSLVKVATMSDMVDNHNKHVKGGKGMQQQLTPQLPDGNLTCVVCNKPVKDNAWICEPCLESSLQAEEMRDAA